MDALRRHDLVRLTAPGWQRALQQHHDDAQARHVIAHWAAHDLPLVVATQPKGQGDLVSLGLPAPANGGRHRLSLRIAKQELRRGEAAFPLLRECSDDLPRDVARRRESRDALSCALPEARVYGSYGWQRITGLQYVSAASDLDLLLPVVDTVHADNAATLLMLADVVRPRLDGELLFEDGRAVSWREWSAWRRGDSRAVLVKALGGASLATSSSWRDPQRATVVLP